LPADTTFMDKLTALCKRRGFIFQSSEIYGGLGGFWDYGPLGVELKRNIKNAWWHDCVIDPPVGPDGRQVTMVGLDCSIIMNPKVWEASGHATGFADPMVDCIACKKRFRADRVLLVTVCAAGTIRNLSAVVDGNAAPEVDESSERRTTVAIEKDVVFGITAAKAAIEAYGKANNIGYLKRIDAGAEQKKPTLRYWVFKAYDDKWDRDHGRPHQFECIIEELLTARFTTGSRPCPACHTPSSLTEPRQFNLMFKTFVGALEDASAQAWLRPETAQGIFANFKNVLDTSRVKIPFGIAQVGKAFRNEINPRNYTFRSREFEQMEIEFFCKADEDCRRDASGRPIEPTSLDWYQFWRNERYNWYVRHGLKSEKLRLRDQGKEELAHYSSACADIEYLFPFSDEFQELEGCAHRGCFDLSQHQKHSGVDLTYFDQERWDADKAAGTTAGAGSAGGPAPGRSLEQHEVRSRNDRPEASPSISKELEKELKNKPPYRFLATVIEPSAGADRATLAFLCEAYTEDSKPDAKGVMQTRVYMRFHPRLAPIKAAFLPLVNKEGMPDVADKLYREARKHFNVFYDDGGSIGRRYARMDEAGTPFCITIDGDTVKTDGEDAGTVTIRDRDTLQQVRVKTDDVVAWLRGRLQVDPQ
jgi:glycyl-tRNA synthetase